MEEWLDDNKLLLGTIGMVILVVQVGRLTWITISVYFGIRATPYFHYMTTEKT